MAVEKKSWSEMMAEKCIACRDCMESCRILSELDECPAAIAARGIKAEEAFGCALCGKCEATCNLGLSAFRMFEQRRVEAVQNGEIDVNEYRYLFPDREVTVMSLFQEFYGVDYSGFNVSTPSDTGFLPGCTMYTYSPQLTRKIYTTLREMYEAPAFFDDCCGLPMYQIGLPARGDKIKERLKEKIKQLGVKRLVVACPNCYYQLKKETSFQDIELITVYDALQSYFRPNRGKEIYAVHDSCPDRFEGIIGRQVREALDRIGCRRTEMAHHGRNSVCCGSSGQLGHFKPEWATEHELQNLEEAKSAGATVLLAYCHACVLNFGNISGSGIEVRHALNVLLDFEEDYDAVKGMAEAMFAGEQGYDLYARLMDD